MKRCLRGWVTLLVVPGLLLMACAAPAASGAPAPAAAPAPASGAPAPSPAPTTGMPRAEQQLYEAAKKEGEVIVWASSWPHGAVEKLFMERYPGIKVNAWDGPTGAQMGARLIEEAKSGVKSADFLFFATPDMVPLLEAGLLEKYTWPDIAGMPAQPAHKLYFTPMGSARAPVYHTRLVSPAEAPKKWEDVMSPRWRDRSLLSTSGEAAPLVFAYLWRDGNNLSWDRATKFWRDVRATARPSVQRGFSTPTELLAAGEYEIFLLGSMGATTRLIRRGAPLAPAPIGEYPADTFSIAVLKNAPHPAATRLFADFYTRPEVMAAFSDAGGHPSLSPEARKISRLGKEYEAMGLTTMIPLPGEIQTEANLAKAAQLWREITAAR